MFDATNLDKVIVTGLGTTLTNVKVHDLYFYKCFFNTGRRTKKT